PEKNEKKEKDFWDKVDVVLRPINGLLTALAVAILGYYTSSIVRQNELRETNERVYTELMSSREQAESSLRKDMFLSIIQTFLRPDAAGLEAKMLNLEMLAYNFHESLNLKPLFAHLDRQLLDTKDPSKAAYVNRLNQVAKEITTRQLVLLEQVGRKYGRTVDFDKLKANPGGLELDPEKLTLEGTEREFMLSILDVNTQAREITVELGVRTKGDSSNVQRRTFHVNYYDFPMIDNTRLSNDQRAAVILNQANEGGADLTIVYFPGSYASLKEKFLTTPSWTNCAVSTAPASRRPPKPQAQEIRRCCFRRSLAASTNTVQRAMEWESTGSWDGVGPLSHAGIAARNDGSRPSPWCPHLPTADGKED